MKTLIKTTLLLVLTLTFFNCSKSDNPLNPISGNGSLTATINGADFVSTDTSPAIISNDNGAIFLSLTGENLNDKTISLGVKNYSGPGTYPLYVGEDDPADSEPLAILFYNDPVLNETSIYSTNSGSITITEDSGTQISGTFNFTQLKVLEGSPGPETITITNGNFSSWKFLL